jgi:hypothetical protein
MTTEPAPPAEPEPPSAKAAIQSLTLRSAAVIAIAAAANRLGVVLPEGAAQETAASLIDLVVTLGLIGVAVGRARARTTIV